MAELSLVHTGNYSRRSRQFVAALATVIRFAITPGGRDLGEVAG